LKHLLWGGQLIDDLDAAYLTPLNKGYDDILRRCDLSKLVQGHRQYASGNETVQVTTHRETPDWILGEAEEICQEGSGKLLSDRRGAAKDLQGRRNAFEDIIVHEMVEHSGINIKNLDLGGFGQGFHRVDDVIVAVDAMCCLNQPQTLDWEPLRVHRTSLTST